MFRRDIEGLRAIAVLLVVLAHAHFLGLDSGFIGVDVFFVVSGFLITGLLIEEHRKTGRISIANFYARRARRILPASAIIIVATVAASWYWLEPLRSRLISMDAIGGGGFFANIVFAVRSTDYFQWGAAPSPLQHLWSLSLEEQFYVVWPGLLALLFLWGRGRRTAAITVIGLLSAGSLAVSIILTTTNQPWAFFGLHARAWELGVGALLALVLPSIEQIPHSMRAVTGWAGIAVVIAAAFLIGDGNDFPGWIALAPVLGTAVIIAAGNDNPYGPVRVLSLAPLQWIGARSYSLYLWHWPALIIAEGRAGRPLTAGERLGALGIALAGAVLSHQFVENPIRHARVLSRRAAPALLLGGALVAASIGAGVVLRADRPTLATDVVAAAPTLAPTSTAPAPPPTDAPDSSAAPASGSSGPTASTAVALTAAVTTTTLPTAEHVVQAEPLAALEDALATKVVPKNLRPSLGAAMGDKPKPYDNDCHRSPAATSPKLCEYGDLTSDFTVGLYGDSHAMQWFDALEAMAVNNHWRLLVLTKSGCPIIDRISYKPTAGGRYPSCRPWRRGVMQMLQEQNVRVLFMTNASRLLDNRTHQPFSTATVADGLDELIGQLKAIGVSPILLTDTAYQNSETPVCLSNYLRRVSRCAALTTTAVRKSRIQVVIDAAKRNNVEYFDVQPLVCTKRACPVIMGDILMYRDSDHLSTVYVQFLTPILEQSIAPYVNGVRAGIAGVPPASTTTTAVPTSAVPSSTAGPSGPATSSSTP